MARLVSGVTFGGWNWMRVRPRLWYSWGLAQCIPSHPPLTIGGTILKESDDLVILGVTFDSKMTFEKHLRSVSRAASQRLGILWKSWQVFQDRSLLGRCYLGFVLPVLECCSAVWCSAADTHLRLLDRAVGRARFLTRGVFECDIFHRRFVAVQLGMLYKIRCKAVHPLNGALPGGGFWTLFKSTYIFVYILTQVRRSQNA